MANTTAFASRPQAGFVPDKSDRDCPAVASAQLLVIEPRAAFARRALAEDFPPRSLDVDWVPSAWATARWVAEQEAKAFEAARRARATCAASAGTAPMGWLERLEDTLDRMLPGSLGCLLQLFIFVSLSMALISALLPMLDRF